MNNKNTVSVIYLYSMCSNIGHLMKLRNNVRRLNRSSVIVFSNGQII